MAVKVTGKRDVKSSAQAMPLLQGEMEEDFEEMAKVAEAINPSLDVGFLDVEVRDKDRARPVESVAKKGTGETAAKRPRRGDFNFKGKARSKSPGRKSPFGMRRSTRRKIDVPYVSTVNSCDPREGLCEIRGLSRGDADHERRRLALGHTRRSRPTSDEHSRNHGNDMRATAQPLVE